MRPDALQGWMFKLAKAAEGDAHGFVFGMREVLTAAYREGFEDGHHAADKDDFVRREIERKTAAREDTVPHEH